MSQCGTTSYMSDLTGDRRCTDTRCDCGYPAYHGFPCHHNVKHALTAKIPVLSLVHYKDSMAGWRDQYSGVDMPVLSFNNIKTSQFIDENVRYPPVVAPKTGRPKSTRRFKSAEEVALTEVFSNSR